MEISSIVESNGRRYRVHTSRSTNPSGPAFGEVLRNASAQHTVQTGDTLSAIVLDHLRANGVALGSAGLYEAVERVAADNGILDPNRIHVGQQIDLSVLSAGGWYSSERDAAPHSAHAHEDFDPTFRRAAANYMRRETTTGAIVAGESRVTSTYGMRPDPIDGDMRFHRGVDIAAREGTPIMPIDIGVVVFSGWRGGHGNTVIVRHPNGLESLYGHASELLVQPGDRVYPHTPIAEVGSTGRSTGPHVHVEVRRDGEAINPRSYRPRSQASLDISERF